MDTVRTGHGPLPVDRGAHVDVWPRLAPGRSSAPRSLAGLLITLALLCAASVGLIVTSCSSVQTGTSRPASVAATTGATVSSAVTDSPTVVASVITSESATSTLAPSATKPNPIPATVPLPFDSSNAMAYIRHFSDDIGVRKGGSAAETRAANYLLEALKGWGYSDAQIREVPIPNGKTSHAVWATRKGTRSGTIVLGAHIDSKSPSPGANDNASGSGVLLELARDLKDAKISPSVTFVWFGNEEMIDHNGDHHHYGSRWFVRNMPAELRRDIVGMVSVDMVGYGERFAIRSMGQGPQAMVDLLSRRFTDAGLRSRYAEDPGAYGWSDHEPFELAGIPAAWLEWQDDPVYHTADDRASHVQPLRIEQTGRALRTFLIGLKARDLVALRKARR